MGEWDRRVDRMRKTLIAVLIMTISILASGCALAVVAPPPDDPNAEWLGVPEAVTPAQKEARASGAACAPVLLIAAVIGVIGSVIFPNGRFRLIFELLAAPGLILFVIG